MCAAFFSSFALFKLTFSFFTPNLTFCPRLFYVCFSPPPLTRHYVTVCVDTFGQTQCRNSYPNPKGGGSPGEFTRFAVPISLRIDRRTRVFFGCGTQSIIFLHFFKSSLALASFPILSSCERVITSSYDQEVGPFLVVLCLTILLIDDSGFLFDWRLKKDFFSFNRNTIYHFPSFN